MITLTNAKKEVVDTVTKVWNLETVENLRSFLMKKPKGFYVSSLLFRNKSTKVLVSDLMVAPNRMQRLLPIEKDVDVLTTQGLARKRPAYSKALLNLEIEGKAAMARVVGRKIYRIGDGIDTRFVMYIQNKKAKLNGFYDLLTNKKVDPKEFVDANGRPKAGVVVYNDPKIGAQTCTNGQLKCHNITLVADNLPGFDPVKAWDLVTYGASTILTRHPGEEVSPKDVAQVNTRLSAYKAPSVPAGEIEVVAYYMGKLMFKGTKDEYRDGFAFLQAERLSDIFTKMCKGNYAFMPFSTDGLMVQCRPWMNKVMAETVRSEYLCAFLDFLTKDKQDNVVLLHQGKITKAEQEAFEYAVLHKGKSRNLSDEEKAAGKLDFGGKIVIIAKNGVENLRTFQGYVDYRKIQFFTDLNGLKAPYDLTRRSMLNMLDMSHENHDISHKSNTSTQLIQSMMVLDPKKTEDVMDRLSSNYLERKLKTLMAEEGSAPRYEDFVSSSDTFRPDYQEILGRVAPQFASKYYAPLWHSLVDNVMKGYVKNVRKLSFPTAGAYTKVVADCAADFGVRILGIDPETSEVEVVCPVATKYRIERLIALKYPKMHIFEYLKGKVISWNEYCERIDKSEELTDIQKQVIKNHVSHLSGGAIMIPAVEHLKNMLAGMDFDGDAAQLFFDRDIVDILWHGKTKAVIIDENDVTKPEEDTETVLDADIQDCKVEDATEIEDGVMDVTPGKELVVA